MVGNTIINLLCGRMLDCWSLKVSRVVNGGGDSSSMLGVSLVGEGCFLRKMVLKTACFPSGVA